MRLSRKQVRNTLDEMVERRHRTNNHEPKLDQKTLDKRMKLKMEKEIRDYEKSLEL